jgi:hypothetical protein
LSNYHDPIEAQSHSIWTPIANPFLPLKSLVADYQRVTNPLISAIFATIGNLARKYANFEVKINRPIWCFKLLFHNKDSLIFIWRCFCYQWRIYFLAYKKPIPHFP